MVPKGKWVPSLVEVRPPGSAGFGEGPLWAVAKMLPQGPRNAIPFLVLSIQWVPIEPSQWYNNKSIWYPTCSHIYKGFFSHPIGVSPPKLFSEIGSILLLSNSLKKNVKNPWSWSVAAKNCLDSLVLKCSPRNIGFKLKSLYSFYMFLYWTQRFLGLS